MWTRAKSRQRTGDERGDRLGGLVLVADAEPAPDIDVPQLDAELFQSFDQDGQALDRRDERPGFGQERSDVTAYAHDFEAFEASGELVEPHGFAMRDAELVLAQPGRDVGV